MFRVVDLGFAACSELGHCLLPSIVDAGWLQRKFPVECRGVGCGLGLRVGVWRLELAV